MVNAIEEKAARKKASVGTNRSSEQPKGDQREEPGREMGTKAFVSRHSSLGFPLLIMEKGEGT